MPVSFCSSSLQFSRLLTSRPFLLSIISPAETSLDHTLNELLADITSITTLYLYLLLFNLLSSILFFENLKTMDEAPTTPPKRSWASDSDESLSTEGADEIQSQWQQFMQQLGTNPDIPEEDPPIEPPADQTQHLDQQVNTEGLEPVLPTETPGDETQHSDQQLSTGPPDPAPSQPDPLAGIQHPDSSNPFTTMTPILPGKIAHPPCPLYLQDNQLTKALDPSLPTVDGKPSGFVNLYEPSPELRDLWNQIPSVSCAFIPIINAKLTMLCSGIQPHF